MKIAFISSGNSIHVKKIANALSKKGHAITLYTLKNHDKLLGDFDSSVRIVKLPISGKKGYYLNAFKLKKMIKKEKFDLINAHYATGYGTLARLVNTHPYVLAVFGSDVYEYPYKSKMAMKQVKKNLDAADVLTSTSNVMKKEVLKFYKSNKEIYVTPFGVDLKKFHKNEIEEKDYFEFGIVKKIEPKYGIDILIKAYSMFCKEFKDVKSKLVIYGKGSAEEEYKCLAKKLNIVDSVEFKGFIKNDLVPKAFSEMDVACFPSIVDSESFGVAAVEAMACSIPIIASDASGFTRKAMGISGRLRVEQLYDFEKNMDDYEKAIMHAVK